MPDDGYVIFGSPLIGPEEIAAVTETLESGWIGTGPRVAAFQQAFSEYMGARHALAVNSCTAALHLALLAAGIGPGDEVITTALTFAATGNVILHTGATPVMVDVDRRTMNIDVEQVAAAVTERTRAIMPVHFAGRPCDLDGLATIATRHDLTIIEDAAHAIEASYHGRKIGTISPLTCFSFYVTKNLTTAEGGMVTTSDKAMADEIKVRALHGLSADAWKRFSDDGYKHYEVIYPGYKYNMIDLQAAIGLCQLAKLEAGLRRRETLWQRYDEALTDLPCTTPAPPEKETRHARHLYTLLIHDDAPVSRDRFMSRLYERGVGSGVHYRALHTHAFYRERFGFRPEDFPNAYFIGEHTISIPLSPKVTDEQADRVIAAVRAVLGGSH